MYKVIYRNSLIIYLNLYLPLLKDNKSGNKVKWKTTSNWYR